MKSNGLFNEFGATPKYLISTALLFGVGLCAQAFPGTSVTADNDSVTVRDELKELNDSTTALDEVVVNGNRIIRTVEKTVVYPERTILEHNASTLGVLNQLMLKGLEVNEALNSVSIKGQSVIFKINGVPKNLNDILLLPPPEIARIEYSDQPSIRESNAGIGGVINFILKKKESGGNLFAYVRRGLNAGMLNAALAGNVNHKNSQFSLSFNTENRNYHKCLSSSVEEYLAGEEPITRTSQDTKGHLLYWSHNITATYTLVPSSRTLFSVSASYNFGPWKRTTKGLMAQNNGEKTQNYTDASFAKRPTNTPSLDIYLSHTFNNGSTIEFNSETGYNHSENVWENEHIFADETTQKYINDSKSDRWSFFNSLYWRKRINTYMLTFGAEDTYSHSKNEYMTNTQNIKSKFSNNRLYAYGELAGNVRKFSYTIGTALHYIHIKDDESISRNFVQNFSTIRWKLGSFGPVSFDGSFRYTPSFPSVSSLDDVYLIRDDLNATIGNPNLKTSNSFFTNADVNFQINGFSTYAGYSFARTWDPMYGDIWYDGSYYVSQVKNGKYEQAQRIYLNLSYQKKFSDELTAGIQATGIIYFMKSALSAHESRSITSKYLYGNAYIIWKNWTLSMSGNTIFKNLSTNYLTWKGGYTDITLQYKWKDFNFYADLSWIGDKNGDWNKSRRLSSVNPAWTKYVIRDNHNTINVGVRYMVNFGRQLQVNRHNKRNANKESDLNLID
jgi:hypothetical protein